MILIRPQLQKVWRWPAVVNFSFGGMGTGLYVLGALVLAAQSSDAGFASALKLTGPALASIGFVALATEAGRPLRGINLFRHLRRSWMSRETLAAAIFIPFAVLDWLWPHPVLQGLALLAALSLLSCQGMIVYRARGVTAWNVSVMPVLFLASGLAKGFGLVLIAFALSGIAPGGAALFVGFACVLFNLLTWLRYLRQPNAAFQAATEALRRNDSLILSVGVGQLLPLVLVYILAALSLDATLMRAWAALGGVALLFGGVMQKASVMLQAGYLRAIALNIPRVQAVVQPKV